jgi:hypothetical protein
VNIAALRMYYFPKPKKDEQRVVMTFPIGIGKVGLGDAGRHDEDRFEAREAAVDTATRRCARSTRRTTIRCRRRCHRGPTTRSGFTR